jgi:hypothetical protein
MRRTNPFPRGRSVFGPRLIVFWPGAIAIGP